MAALHGLSRRSRDHGTELRRVRARGYARSCHPSAARKGRYLRVAREGRHATTRGARDPTLPARGRWLGEVCGTSAGDVAEGGRRVRRRQRVRLVQVSAPTRAALLVVHTNSYFANLIPIARLLAKSGAYEPVFYFALPYPTLARDL